MSHFHNTNNRFPEDPFLGPAQRARNVVAIDRLELANDPPKPTKPFPEEIPYESLPEEFHYESPANQSSDYRQGNKAAPNNNLFFEERSNPLSSKGN